MGDVAVENPVSVTPLTKPGALDALANLDSLDGTGVDGNDEYATLKRLQRHLEYVRSRLLDKRSGLTSNTGISNCRRNTSRMSRGMHFEIREALNWYLIPGIYRSLKRELVRAQEEIKRIQSVPLVIGQFMEAIDQKYAHNCLASKQNAC
jgi:26S proteasome regulatory subunit T3